jgi:hypothetical protein
MRKSSKVWGSEIAKKGFVSHVFAKILPYFANIITPKFRKICDFILNLQKRLRGHEKIGQL